MKKLADSLLMGAITRRSFIRRMTAAGFSAAAAKAAADMLKPLASTASPVKTKTITGTGGQLIAEQVEAAGVRYVFLANSSGMGALADALIDHPRLQLIQGLAESQVVGMASGYAMASRTTSFACFSRVGGPIASANTYNASKDRTPIVILTDHADVMAEGRDGHEDLNDWLTPMKEFTKWQWVCKEAARIPEWVSHAFKMAGTAPGGPTFLRIPRNVIYQKNIKAEIFPKESIRIPTKLSPDAKTIVEAAKMLIESKSPLLFVGSEVWASGAVENVVELVEVLGMPVCQAISWASDFPTDHPLFLGSYIYPMRFPEEMDLFLNLGARMPDQGAGPPAVPRSAKIIHGAIEAGQIGTSYPIDLGIPGDVGETARLLVSAIKGMLSTERLTALSQERWERGGKYTRAIKQSFRTAAQAQWDSAPISWPRAMWEINRELDRDAIIVPEVGTEDWVHRSFNFGPQQKTKIGRTLGRSLGWGVSAAIGVKLACPDQQVVALQGDGGFLFGQTDGLWPMSRYDVPVLVVVFNNRSYDEPRNNIWMKAGRSYEEGKDMICYLGSPDVDFTLLAKAHGIKGERAENPDQLRAALQRGVATTRDGRPYLIEAMIARRGLGAESTWYPQFSLAKARVRKA